MLAETESREGSTAFQRLYLDAGLSRASSAARMAWTLVPLGRAFLTLGRTVSMVLRADVGTLRISSLA
jgi:hypothetical protein